MDVEEPASMWFLLEAASVVSLARWRAAVQECVRFWLFCFSQTLLAFFSLTTRLAQSTFKLLSVAVPSTTASALFWHLELLASASMAAVPTAIALKMRSAVRTDVVVPARKLDLHVTCVCVFVCLCVFMCENSELRCLASCVCGQPCKMASGGSGVCQVLQRFVSPFHYVLLLFFFSLPLLPKALGID